MLINLVYIQAAITEDPKNPLAKLERASVLISMEQFQPALIELEALKVKTEIRPLET